MITRAPRPKSNFYLLDKAISEDRRIGWAARGILIFLLGKPDNWTVSPAALVNETKDAFRSTGRDGVYAALKELKQAGYLRTHGARNDGGVFAGADYIVSEQPHTENPDTVDSPDTEKPEAVAGEAPHTGLPDTANPTLVSTDNNQGLRKEEQGLKKKAQAPAPAPEGVSPEVWTDYLGHKAKLKATVNATVLKTIAKELSLAADMGWAPDDALAEAMSAGWKGIKAAWLQNRNSGPAATNARPSFAQQRAQAEIDDFVNGPSSRDDNVIDMETPRVGF